MVKKMVVIMIVLLFAISAYSKDFSAWLYGNDSSLGTRLGYNISEKTEVGIECVWLKENDVPQTWGAYGLFKWPETVKFPNPIPLEFLPKELTGTPYIGVQTGLSLDNQGTFVGPIAGIVIEKILFIEWQYISADFALKEANQQQNIVIGFLFNF